MAKKNPAVLWNVDQTGDVIGAEGRTTAQGNVGLGDDFVKSSKTNKKYVTHVSRNDDGTLKVNVLQPSLSDLQGLDSTTQKNMSIVTAGDNDTGITAGTIIAKQLAATKTSSQESDITFVSDIAEDGQGNVSFTTKPITRATDDGKTAGITPLLTTTYVSYEPVKATDVAVTPTGLWNAIETLDVDNLQEGDAGYDEHILHITGFGADKTLSTLTETDGKISATFQPIAIGGSAITLNTASQAVVTDSSKNLTTKNLQFIDSSATIGSDTNKFVSSVTADSTGKISVTKSTLAAATSSAIGGIQLVYTVPGYNYDKKYAVQMDTTGDNAGKAYVQVPWQDTHYTSNNIICSSSTGTTDGAVTESDTAYLNHKDNGIVTSSHQILGSGVIVTADNSGNLTLSSSLSTFTTFLGTSNITTLNIDAISKQLSQDGTPFGYYVPPVTSASDVGKVLTVTESSGSYSVKWTGSVIELDQDLSKTSTNGLENRGIYDGIGMPNVYVRNMTSVLTPPKLIHGCQTSNETTKNIISVAVNTSAYTGMTVKLLVSIVDSNKSYTYILDIKYQNSSPTWAKTSLLSMGPDHSPGWAIYRSSITATQTTIGIGRVMGSSETVPSALDTVNVSVYPLMVDGGATVINVDTETWSSVPVTPILPTVVPSGAYGGVGSESYPVYVDTDGNVKESGIIVRSSNGSDSYNIGSLNHLIINYEWLAGRGSWWGDDNMRETLCTAMHDAEVITMYRHSNYGIYPHENFTLALRSHPTTISHPGGSEDVWFYRFSNGFDVYEFNIVRVNSTGGDPYWEMSSLTDYPFSTYYQRVDTSGTYDNNEGTIYLL
jgi:hypothetical protein